jgi:PAS domain S-box-containing protein
MNEVSARGEPALVDAVIDAVDAPVVVLDREGRIVRFNRACEAASGYDRDDVVGIAFWNVLLPPERAWVARDRFFAMRDDRLPSRAEVAWITRDGVRKIVSWTITPVRDETGAVASVVVTGAGMGREA